MRSIAVIASCLMVVGCDAGPSCEERGGERKLSHFIQTPMRIGNTTTFTQTPVYKCVGAKEVHHGQKH